MENQAGPEPGSIGLKNLILEARHGGDRFVTRWIILSTIGNI